MNQLLIIHPQGFEHPYSVNSGAQADAILTYAYDSRDIIVGEWFTSERKYRRVLRLLEFQRKEVQQARRRLENAWSGVKRVRDVIHESGLTNNVDLITKGRDLSAGAPDQPPVDIAYIYVEGETQPLCYMHGFDKRSRPRSQAISSNLKAKKWLMSD